MSLISRIENYRYRWWHLPFWLVALPWIIVILAPIGFLCLWFFDNSVKIAASVFLHDRFLNPPGVPPGTRGGNPPDKKN